MTVRELIEKLKTFDPGLPIYIRSGTDDYNGWVMYWFDLETVKEQTVVVEDMESVEIKAITLDYE